MRIIAGEFRGRRFNPPANNWPTRPTTDIAKEGLFNILTNRFEFAEIRMLDLFGGTGNHTYEALSRGCREVTYVDRHLPAVTFVQETLRTLGMDQYVNVQRSDALKFIRKSTKRFDYIFAGPPYGMPTLDQLPDLISESEILTECGLFVLEHNSNHNFESHPSFMEIRMYGGTHFSFFVRQGPK